MALEVESSTVSELREADIKTFITKDSGPGGQHRNKTETCVVMRHLPTGIEAKAASKSQYRNRISARELLEARVNDYYRSNDEKELDIIKKDLAGSGMRGDKIKTYRVQDDIVIDHRSNTKYSLKNMKKGKKL